MRLKPEVKNPKLFLTELLRRDFATFLRKAWPTINGGAELQWNWHLDAICAALNKVTVGEDLRLLVTLPPRNGKSKTISVIWVAWMLGRDPSRNFVCVSYSNELSGKLARDCVAIMRAAWYRELFPAAIISSNRFAAHDFVMTAGGGRLATSVTGTLTGRGGDIIILDDVIKPEETNSETNRNAVNNWYQSTLTSRLDDKATGAIICVMQRLHQYDLAGMLIESGMWVETKLPAIATEDAIIPLTRGRVHHRNVGDVLHPARESREILAEIQHAMGSAVFSAQYQQDPLPVAGNLFKAAWLGSYEIGSLPLERGTIVMSIDTANKPNENCDYSVILTALLLDKHVYVLDVTRDRLEFTELKHKVIELARRHKPKTILIEDAASGTQLHNVLYGEKPAGITLPIKRKVIGDKVTRAQGASAFVEARRLHLPTFAPWLGVLKTELLGFPSAKHDDQVDALTQLLAWVQERDVTATICNL